MSPAALLAELPGIRYYAAKAGNRDMAAYEPALPGHLKLEL